MLHKKHWWLRVNVDRRLLGADRWQELEMTSEGGIVNTYPDHVIVCPEVSHHDADRQRVTNNLRLAGFSDHEWFQL